MGWVEERLFEGEGARGSEEGVCEVAGGGLNGGNYDASLYQKHVVGRDFAS